MQGQRYGVVHETVPASVLPSRGALTILRQSFVLRSVKNGAGLSPVPSDQIEGPETVVAELGCLGGAAG